MSFTARVAFVPERNDTLMRIERDGREVVVLTRDEALQLRAAITRSEAVWPVAGRNEASALKRKPPQVILHYDGSQQTMAIATRNNLITWQPQIDDGYLSMHAHCRCHACKGREVRMQDLKPQ